MMHRWPCEHVLLAWPILLGAPRVVILLTPHILNLILSLSSFHLASYCVYHFPDPRTQNLLVVEPNRPLDV